ncbi:MAG: glycosyltransferase family 2 protein [Lachnospiraceae bacterium]|nr:glycosyltransferase family 2 protein [Lachnospiraceae bacterium]
MEKALPLVSIIIPVYNAERYLPDTIRSVKAQTYENWELLLVDDVSRDKSREVIGTFLEDERIRLIALSGNGGAAAARNRGIREASGSFIAFLDADDLWMPEKLEKQLSHMERTGADFGFTSYVFGDENASPSGRIVPAPKELSYREALSRTVIFTSTVMFRVGKEKEGPGLSREEILFPSCPSEDTALWWRLLRTGYTASGLDEVLTVYRRPAASLSSNKLTAIRRIWALYRKMEGFGILKSIRYFIPWSVRATLRRL